MRTAVVIIIHAYDCCYHTRMRRSQTIVATNVTRMTLLPRLANRVLLVGGAERDNTEDGEYAAALAAAQQRLQAAIAPAVRAAKQVALGGAPGAPHWRRANAEVGPCCTRYVT